MDSFLTFLQTCCKRSLNVICHKRFITRVLDIYICMRELNAAVYVSTDHILKWCNHIILQLNVQAGSSASKKDVLTAWLLLRPLHHRWKGWLDGSWIVFIHWGTLQVCVTNFVWKYNESFRGWHFDTCLTRPSWFFKRWRISGGCWMMRMLCIFCRQ